MCFLLQSTPEDRAPVPQSLWERRSLTFISPSGGSIQCSKTMKINKSIEIEKEELKLFFKDDLILLRKSVLFLEKNPKP